MAKSVYGRFKEIYESGTDYKIGWSNLDKDGNLTVGIRDSNGKEVFCLHVAENEKGEIVWW